MVDFNLSEGSPTINQEADLIIQQIDLLFDTAKHEVMGDQDFGTDYDQFLFNMQASNAAIAYKIESDLGKMNLFGFIPHVDVTILEGTQNDIILCKIELVRGDEYYEKTYKIQ